MPPPGPQSGTGRARKRGSDRLEASAEADAERARRRHISVDFRSDRSDSARIAADRLVALDAAARGAAGVEQVAGEQFDRPVVIPRADAQIDQIGGAQRAVNVTLDQPQIAGAAAFMAGGELDVALPAAGAEREFVAHPGIALETG